MASMDLYTISSFSIHMIPRICFQYDKPYLMKLLPFKNINPVMSKIQDLILTFLQQNIVDLVSLFLSIFHTKTKAITIALAFLEHRISFDSHNALC